MRIKILIFILVTPLCLIAQRKENTFKEKEWWVSGGIIPLQKGGGFYAKTQLNIIEIFGINIQAGYGTASPNKYFSKVYYMNTQGAFISGGIVYKTSDYRKGREGKRKLNLFTTFSLVLGQGKEEGKFYFQGKDFGNYLSSESYSQKYDFNYFQLVLGATYRFKEKWNLELAAYATNRPDKNRLGAQYFTVFGNYAYSCYGQIGMNVGVGYLLLKPKSKK